MKTDLIFVVQNIMDKNPRWDCMRSISDAQEKPDKTFFYFIITFMQEKFLKSSINVDFIGITIIVNPGWDNYL